LNSPFYPDLYFGTADVLEPNADVSKQTVGQRLIVDNGDHEFADLDELIVNYVQALARRVEEIMSHEKYKRGSDEAIRGFGTIVIWMKLTVLKARN
jgi:hypothetical protein